MADVHQQLPRCDLEAEAAVLSAALHSQDAALEAMEILQAGDFFADGNRRIFMAIAALFAEGEACDVVSVVSKLRAIGRLEQVGGTPYIAQLADATPAVAHVAEHARIVRNLARIRRAGDVFALLAAEARASEIADADEWLEACEARACAATLERGGDEPTAADYRVLAASAYEQVAAAANAGTPALGRLTGFAGLDQHIGGVDKGDLIVVAGRPGMGKTAFALQVVETIAREVKDPGLGIVCSLEMTRQRLMMRSLARVAGDSVRQLRIGQPFNWSRVSDAAALLGTLPIIVDDEPGLTPLKLRAKVRRHHATLRSAFPNLPLGVIVVDYIQLMEPDAAKRGATRTEELTQITRQLKLIAKEYQCTVLALSQLRRPAPGKTAQRPELTDLRDSGSIEQDADVVIAIHRDDAFRKPGEKLDGKAELIVMKGRNSGEGVHTVRFDGARTQFIDDEAVNLELPLNSGGRTNGNGYQHDDRYERRYP